MAIDANEIERYIFDPENPKQCKSYKLLLNIAKKKNSNFISPEFLQYFFAEQIITKKFEEELWDKPDNYRSLTATEKLEPFKTKVSYNDLFELVQTIDFNVDKILKFSFLNSLNNFYVDEQIIFNDDNTIKYNLNYLKENIIMLDNDYSISNIRGEEYNKNYILFSKNYFEILNGNISKSSIFI
ncbi:MAG: hypothetical protein DRP93_08650, partial [Candidatus Neomarinimicrobiota bacterium]